MCFYLIKKYFFKFEKYIYSSLLSIYYDIPRNKITKYIDYQNNCKYINSFNLFHNDIDNIIIEFIIGKYKILKIYNHEFYFLLKYFKNENFTILNSNNRRINLNINYEISKNICDFIIIIILLYPEPFILNLYNIESQTNINSSNTTLTHINSYKYFRFKDPYVDNNLLQLTINDFHHFIRIINYFRNDFNILYEYILDNSNHLKNDTLLSQIKIR